MKQEKTALENGLLEESFTQAIQCITWLEHSARKTLLREFRKRTLLSCCVQRPGNKHIQNVTIAGMPKHADKFDGQHSDEIVLYTIHEHPIVVMTSYVKVALAAGMALITTFVAAGVLAAYSGLILTFGWLLTLLIGIGGAWAVHAGEDKNVAYITDRRIVRFHASSPFTVNTRALAWDEAVKVKTYSPNFLWRMMNVGTVVVHAKSTVITTQEAKNLNTVTDDDVEIDNVYYYRDLGNYIDKLLYLNRSDRKKLKDVKPFVAKPKGKRD